MDALTWTIFLAGIFLLWIVYCNEKTSRQRLLLIDVVFYELDGSCADNYRQHEFWFRKVSYETHLKSLVFFRDPFKLYDSRLIARLGVA